MRNDLNLNWNHNKRKIDLIRYIMPEIKKICRLKIDRKKSGVKLRERVGKRKWEKEREKLCIPLLCIELK